MPSAAPEVDTRGLTLVGEQAGTKTSNNTAPQSLSSPRPWRCLGQAPAAGGQERLRQPPLAQMHAPLVGPTRNGGNLAAAGGANNVHQNFNSRSGHVEDVGVADFHFDDQIATFDKKGWAADAGGRGGHRRGRQGV